ncbi:MAG: RNA 2',3'-cyclic phosphodiesterase [Syntrophomonadaceae bacterium]|nr:RNA 2',3'-cyclic phosphodiesterase [Syntrophomonadaceae bacterium]
MRLFFAIDIPDPLKKEMSALQKKLGANLSGVKWVEEENLHLTLKFLGEVSDHKLKGIISAAHSNLDNFRPHTLSFTNTGFFPHRNRPRVIWLGISGETDVTREVARRLDESLAPLGFEPDSKRKLHITLGRINKETTGPDLVRRAQEYNGIGEERKFEVAEVRLYSSELTPSGPNYSILEKFVFRY